MVSYQKTRFNASRKQLYLLLFTLFILLTSVVGIPTWIAFQSWPYPNLDLLLFFYTAIPTIWIACLADFGSRAYSIDFREDGFFVKKIAQKTSWHLYSDSLTYNERPDSSKNESNRELRIYLPDNRFLVRSADFSEYDAIRDRFTHHCQLGLLRKVIPLAERNRFRWAIGAFVLIIGLNMLFGYLAHTPTDKTPAKLTSLTTVIYHVSANQTKGVFKGLTLKLHPWPDFECKSQRL